MSVKARPQFFLNELLFFHVFIEYSYCFFLLDNDVRERRNVVFLTIFVFKESFLQFFIAKFANKESKAVSEFHSLYSLNFGIKSFALVCKSWSEIVWVCFFLV